jgi:hypothetical protein
MNAISLPGVRIWLSSLDGEQLVDVSRFWAGGPVLVAYTASGGHMAFPVIDCRSAPGRGGSVVTGSAGQRRGAPGHQGRGAPLASLRPVSRAVGGVGDGQAADGFPAQQAAQIAVTTLRFSSARVEQVRLPRDRYDNGFSRHIAGTEQVRWDTNHVPRLRGLAVRV